MMTNLQIFIKDHPDNWEQLLTEYPYCLKISRDNGYILFKYCQNKSDFSEPIVRESRGIILREEDMEIVCYPFTKFFNYGESYCADIDWSTATVQEKIDGSLIKVWFDKEWHVSTNGTIDAHKAIVADGHTFYEIFEEALANINTNFNVFTKTFDKDYTYMFELVSPYSQVVIPYERADIYYLGQRNNKTFEEKSLFLAMAILGIKFPKIYPLISLEQVIVAAHSLPKNQEGYVIVDDNWHRCKVKSPEYIKAHYFRNNNRYSIRNLIFIILSGEESEFLAYCPHMKDKLDEINKKLLQQVRISSAASMYTERCKKKKMTKKDFYMNISSEFPKWIIPLACRQFDKDEQIFDQINNWDEYKWEKVFKSLEEK